MLDRLPGNSVSRFSFDSMVDDDGDFLGIQDAVVQDYLHSIGENGVPPHDLKLKVGCICSIMRNLTSERGLTKNVRVVVRSIHKHAVEVEILPGENNARFVGQTFLLPRINFDLRLCGRLLRSADASFRSGLPTRSLSTAVKVLHLIRVSSTLPR